MKKQRLSKKTDTAMAALLREYQRQFGFTLLVTDAEGVSGGGENATEDRARRRRIITETMRWGTPFIDLCPRGRLMWGVPLMTNQQVTGGLIATAPARAVERVQAAAEALLVLAEQHNLTNGSLLAARRAEAERERQRAEAIHSIKGVDYDAIRSVYLQEEPALIAAIKKGERGEARAIINRILVGIYFLGRERLELLKSLVLELVVMMCRAAVEAGADPSELFGGHYRALTELARIRDDEALTRWLTALLERIMDAIRDHRRYPNEILLGNALQYMREHLAESQTRDDVARSAGLSPSHFSHLMRAKLNSSFTALLTQYRVDHALQLLTRTTDSIAGIALACGFPDQSYFTKVLKRRTGRTPLAYRQMGNLPKV